MLHAADIGIQRLVHTMQNPVKQDKIVHLRSDMCSTMAPCAADRSTDRKKKSQSHVDPGVHHMCLQLGIMERLAPTLTEAELMRFVCAPPKIVQGVNLVSPNHSLLCIQIVS